MREFDKLSSIWLTYFPEKAVLGGRRTTIRRGRQNGGDNGQNNYRNGKNACTKGASGTSRFGGQQNLQSASVAAGDTLLKPVHTGNKSCRKWRQIVASLSPETATNVAKNGNKTRCFRQHLLPETATFCLRFRQQLNNSTQASLIFMNFRQIVTVFGDSVAVSGNFCRQCGQAITCLRRLWDARYRAIQAEAGPVF